MILIRKALVRNFMKGSYIASEDVTPSNADELDEGIGRCLGYQYLCYLGI
jgi:hypothetical protein